MKIVKYPDNSSYAVVDKESEFTFRINNYEDGNFYNQTTLSEIRNRVNG